MYGWILCNKEIPFCVFDADLYTKYKEFNIYYKHNNRFLNDKIFYENEDYIIILDGVVFNKNELMAASNLEWPETIMHMYIRDIKFVNELRGSFNGFIIDKLADKVVIFTNHFGERPVFYTDISNSNFKCFSSSFNYMHQVFKKNNIPYHLYEKAVVYMLTFGYMIEDCTYYKEVKRLLPGNIALLEKQRLNVIEYHKFNNIDTVNMSDDEAIMKIDELFRKAVKREFDKDKEYNLQSVIDLSGGLDCRIVNYVAKDMGYDNVINISYSKVNSDEYKAMMKLSNALGNDLIFLPLDNASFIKKIDSIVKLNYGLSLYSATTGVMQVLSYLNLTKFGMEHGGLLGDLGDGAFPGKYYIKHEKPSFEKGMRFSRTLPNSYLDKEVLKKFENNELFTLFGRGIMGGLSTQIIRKNFTEYYSPFEDIDFYDFYLKLPLKQRVENKIMQKWVWRYYPQAFSIIEDKTMCKLNDSKIKIGAHLLKRKIVGRLSKYGMQKKLFFNKNNMNPYDYWYHTIDEIRQFIDSYYAENISRLNDNKNLQEMAQELFVKGNTRDKTMTLTVLSVLKQYFI